MSDKMGKTKVTGVNCWISQHPVLVRGTGVNTMQWVIDVERLLFEEGQVEDVAPI